MSPSVVCLVPEEGFLKVVVSKLPNVCFLASPSASNLEILHAVISDELLVIWERSTSPRSNDAKTSAGRTFWLVKSVKGIGTTTTSPATSPSMPHPPQGKTNLPSKSYEPRATRIPLLAMRQHFGFSKKLKNPEPLGTFPPAHPVCLGVLLGSNRIGCDQ